MAQPSPLIGALRRPLRRGSVGAPPLWQNMTEYKWLGAGEVRDGRVVLESCRLTGGFGPRGCGLDDFKKEGRCSDELETGLRPHVN
jgi:hypothetical protein